MRSPRFVPLSALVLGAVLGFVGGCEPLEPSENVPQGLSSKVCYSDSDCAPNACCGEATNPTHVTEAPDCSGVRCTGTCAPNTIDCGRCIAVCRDARCAAACQ